MSPPAGTHRCPGRCGRLIRRIACTRCWRRLPRPFQIEITATASALTLAVQEHRRRVVQDARDWWLENPAPHDPDAGIAGECEHCHTELPWLTTSNGARMPVDEKPDPDRGNVVRINGVAGVLGPTQAAAARSAGQQLHVHHVVTCPHADRWKTKPAPKTRKAGRR